jgi:hypothetical protein
MRWSLIIWALFLTGCVIEDTRQYYWGYTEIVEIMPPGKASRDFRIQWKNERGKYEQEYLGDTTGTGYKIGYRERTLIER